MLGTLLQIPKITDANFTLFRKELLTTHFSKVWSHENELFFRAPFCRWIVELRTNSPTMLSTMIYCERVKLRPKLTTITLITWFVAQVDNSSFGRRCGHQKFGLPNESQILHSGM
ncbi:hypothetical protein J6590_068758 [Homalodisca vitripennis]|nr:hypothetical protein J6590_068758 [Homalodisca vitripennis]